MTGEDTRKQCAATTQKGTRCKNFALADSDFCRRHQPAPTESQSTPRPDVDALRAELVDELEALVERVRAITPNYSPPPFSARGAMKLAGKTIHAVLGRRPKMMTRLQNAVNSDLLDIDTWKGVWYMLNYTLEYQRDFLKRRITGEYETDEWGMDWEFAQAIQPLLDFLYQNYWRIEATGIENIPEEGCALLAGESAGNFPWVGTMVATAVAVEHPDMRQVRSLYRQKFASIPFFSLTFDKLGQVPANVENGSQLLAQGEVVAVYPTDGTQHSISWMHAAKMAVATGAPLIPVAIIGVEGSETVAKLAQNSPAPEAFAPWMSVLGNLPVPTQWRLAFGDAIPTADVSAEADTAQLLALVTAVKSSIAEMRKAHIPHLTV